MTDKPVLMHKEHVATCVCCKNIWFYDGSPHSELTPGDGVEFECFKKHFTPNFVSALHHTMMKAQACPDFDPEP